MKNHIPEIISPEYEVRQMTNKNSHAGQLMVAFDTNLPEIRVFEEELAKRANAKALEYCIYIVYTDNDALYIEVNNDIMLIGMSITSMDGDSKALYDKMVNDGAQIMLPSYTHRKEVPNQDVRSFKGIFTLPKEGEFGKLWMDEFASESGYDQLKNKENYLHVKSKAKWIKFGRAKKG